MLLLYVCAGVHVQVCLFSNGDSFKNLGIIHGLCKTFRRKLKLSLLLLLRNNHNEHFHEYLSRSLLFDATPLAPRTVWIQAGIQEVFAE